jgi:hypothetical protein
MQKNVDTDCSTDEEHLAPENSAQSSAHMDSNRTPETSENDRTDAENNVDSSAMLESGEHSP